MRIHTAESQAMVTPKKALGFLREGNRRFQKNLKANRNLLQQVNDTSEDQFPFATILSCIDSRTSAELIFDQGLGDIFSIRIAGNFANTDILGSMEYACKVAGSKLVVVLGHTDCGAVMAACLNSGSGNISLLLDNIKPAVEATKEICSQKDDSSEFVDAVVQMNVEMTVDKIRQKSPVLSQMEREGIIGIVGAVYNIKSGAVEFLETNHLH